MKLRQLRYALEVARRGLNITAASEALYTSQPGISKQIRLLEDELGVDIFRRNGKHLAEITQAGERIVEYIGRLLAEADNIQRVAGEFRDADGGDLAIATTHTQARYALPAVIHRFRRRYPRVSLHLHQAAPAQIARMAAEGQVDFAIATDEGDRFGQLVTLPCYRWNRCVLVKPEHPLAQAGTLSLDALAAQPLITYVSGYTGRSHVDQAFADQGLRPNVVLSAVDADVIKTYVRLDLGVGIIANIAYDEHTDADLVRLPVDHLFQPSTTVLGFRRGKFMRAYMYEFIGMFAPQLTRAVVDDVGAVAEPEQRRTRVAQLLPAAPLQRPSGPNGKDRRLDAGAAAP